MPIAHGLEMLEIPAVLMNGPGTLCPTLFWDGAGGILADAGLPGMTEQFVEAIGRAGLPYERLRRIIVTHHDLDHIGSLAGLLSRSRSGIEVLSHDAEVPYIQGERRPIKMTPEAVAQMQEMLKSMPEPQRRAMQEFLGGCKIKVDRTLADGEILPECGGIEVIHTPGHTPGHICLYHRASRTLVAGDALFVENGRLAPAPPFINADTPAARASLAKLARLDIAAVIAYHGGLYRGDVNSLIAEIAAGRTA